MIMRKVLFMAVIAMALRVGAELYSLACKGRLDFGMGI